MHSETRTPMIVVTNVLECTQRYIRPRPIQQATVACISVMKIRKVSLEPQKTNQTKTKQPAPRSGRLGDLLI